jgi:NAD(P)-dependent dehydrogenase (short-subunit alcohol dehydrogenase family)
MSLIDQAALGSPMAGEVALITGAARGIGREAALAMARLGASVVVADVSPAGAETAAAIARAGGAGLFVQADVSDPEAVMALRAEALARFGHVDVVVNDACVFYPKPLLETTVAEWDRVMAVNLRGAFLTARAFVPDMVARHHGVFVTMESGEGMPFMASYFASKVGLRSIAASLSQEVGQDSGVSVFCFGAGMVDTPGIREALPSLAPLYGMTEAEFIAQSAPGGVLLSAEECGAGLAGCVLYAPRFNGEETAAPAGLALLGLGGARLPKLEVAAIQAHADAVGKAEAAEEAARLIAGIRRECDSLGMFQRQWYRRMLKQRTGLSLEDWETGSRELTALVSGPAADRQAIAEHADELKRLANYFLKLEAEARGYMKDPHQLEEALASLEGRRSAAARAAAALATD